MLLAAAVLAFLFFGGYFERAADDVGVNVNVEAPDVKMPDINIDTDKGESPRRERVRPVSRASEIRRRMSRR